MLSIILLETFLLNTERLLCFQLQWQDFRLRNAKSVQERSRCDSETPTPLGMVNSPEEV